MPVLALGLALLQPESGPAAPSGSMTDIPALFEQAHWIVKVVMIALALMFVVCVYIVIYKAMYISRAQRQSAEFTDAFWRSRDIEQIYKHAQERPHGPISQMFVAGYTELAKLANDTELKGDREGNLANVDRALRKAQTTEITKLESMTPFLASTGAAAPFIGLFGTVVGIMLAFQEISAQEGTATLKTVGPRISEALFATAMGLVAAIPAVMAYNFFVRRLRVLRSEMET